ncbi:MAG: accessory factor UbiK family protein [Gammaproteobacteria bacterium]|nr:accessory factor UbiK family protein [Gammaproteobacteria bacterium]
MIDKQNLNDLAEKLSSVLPENFQTLKSDVTSNFKAILESSLRQMNLVSREEFDVQSALLTRTLEKLKELEKQVEQLK